MQRLNSIRWRGEPLSGQEGGADAGNQAVPGGATGAPELWDTMASDGLWPTTLTADVFPPTNEV